METRKIIILIIMFSPFIGGHSQNMIPRSDAFYDISDTSIAIQGYYETVPLLDFANQEIRDSVESFVAKALPYFVDSAGYSFTLALQYVEQDSGHIHVYIHARLHIGLAVHVLIIDASAYNRQYNDSEDNKSDDFALMLLHFRCLRRFLRFVLLQQWHVLHPPLYHRFVRLRCILRSWHELQFRCRG